jgi:hypothetical protein
MKSMIKSMMPLALIVTVLGTTAQAATWRLKVFNIDDKVDVLIDNTLKHTCTFNTECLWDLTNEMGAGANTIVLRLTNTILGYTYGYVLTKDNIVVGQDVCGIVTEVGCADNDSTRGEVREFMFRVTK